MGSLQEKINSVSAFLQKEGYAIIHGFPPNDWQEVLEVLAAKLGHVRESHNFPKIMDIKPERGGEPASSKGAGDFPLHTDMSWHENPAQILAMFCVNAGRGGGLSLLSDGLQAFNSLDTEQQASLKSDLIEFPAPTHVIATGRTGYIGPVVETKGDLSVVRFNAKCLEGKSVDNPLRCFFEQVRENVITTELNPGTLVVCRNDRFLHGRTEIEGGLETTRHLKRIDIHISPVDLT